MEEEFLVCSCCGRRLSVSMFSRSAVNATGYKKMCKECVREYNKTRYYTTNCNFAFDRMPWPFDNESDEMDMEAIAE